MRSLFTSRKSQWFLTYALIFSAVIVTVGLFQAEIQKMHAISMEEHIPYEEIRLVLFEIKRAFKTNSWNFATANKTYERILEEYFAQLGYPAKVKIRQIGLNLLHVEIKIEGKNFKMIINETFSKI